MWTTSDEGARLMRRGWKVMDSGRAARRGCRIRYRNVGDVGDVGEPTASCGGAWAEYLRLRQSTMKQVTVPRFTGSALTFSTMALTPGATFWPKNSRVLSSSSVRSMIFLF